MTTNKVLATQVANKYIEAGDDDSIIYYQGEYRTIDDVLIEAILPQHREVIIDMHNRGIVSDGNATSMHKKIDRTPHIYNKDMSHDVCLSDDELYEYIDSILKDIGIEKLTLKNIHTVRTNLLVRFLYGEIDLGNYEEMMSILDIPQYTAGEI